MTILASSSAPLWIAGWIIVLALLVGGATYAGRRRGSRR